MEKIIVELTDIINVDIVGTTIFPTIKSKMALPESPATPVEGHGYPSCVIRWLPEKGWYRTNEGCALLLPGRVGYRSQAYLCPPSVFFPSISLQYVLVGQLVAAYINVSVDFGVENPLLVLLRGKKESNSISLLLCTVIERILEPCWLKTNTP